VKACFLGSNLTVPVSDGKLNLGTWQGVWLCEHRDRAGSRKVKNIIIEQYSLLEVLNVCNIGLQRYRDKKLEFIAKIHFLSRQTRNSQVFKPYIFTGTFLYIVQSPAIQE